MSEEEAPTFAPGEELDSVEALADEAADRAEQILGSHLWSVPCSKCRTQRLLATAEKAATALCGACRGEWIAANMWKLPEHHSAPDVSARVLSDFVYVESVEEAHPDPLVTSHAPWPSAVAVPSAVLKLEQAAREAGWEVVHTYARGFGVKRYRGAWQEEENIAVHFSGHPLTGCYAVAVYRTIAGRSSWAWKGVWLWGPDLTPFGHCGATELLEWLLAGAQVPAGWYAALAAKRAEAVARAKTTTVKKVHKEGMS